MASLGDLVVKLKANTSDFRREMSASNATLKKFGKSARSMFKGLAIGGAATAAAGLGLVKLASDAETLTTQFKVLTGSADDAKMMMENLSTFASGTPFGKTELAEAAQTLLAFQFGQEEVIPLLKNLGDVAAGSGAQIGDLATILGRATATGKVQGELLNQLIDRRIHILESLSKATGFASNEIQKMASQGKISGDDLRKAFEIMTGAGGQFENGMVELSKTTAWKWSTMKDNLSQLGETLGVFVLPEVNRFIDALTKLVQHVLPGLEKELEGLEPHVKSFAAGLFIPIDQKDSAGAQRRRTAGNARRQEMKDKLRAARAAVEAPAGADVTVGKQTAGGFLSDILLSKQSIKFQQDLLKIKLAIMEADKKKKGLAVFLAKEEMAAAKDAVSKTKSALSAEMTQKALGAGFAGRGSSEALSTIMRGQQPSEKALAEHKAANKHLKDLVELERKKKLAEFEIQGPV